MTALAHQLQSIDLCTCGHFTDIGLSALTLGCGQLQSINFSGLSSVTIIGISALTNGCSQ
jgi:hypothetical protein